MSCKTWLRRIPKAEPKEGRSNEDADSSVVRVRHTHLPSARAALRSKGDRIASSRECFGVAADFRMSR